VTHDVKQQEGHQISLKFKRSQGLKGLYNRTTNTQGLVAIRSYVEQHMTGADSLL